MGSVRAVYWNSVDDCEFHCLRPGPGLPVAAVVAGLGARRPCGVDDLEPCVEEMDLTAFTLTIGRMVHGRPSYDPSMMTRMRMGTGARGESSVSEAQRAVRGRRSRGEPMNDRSRETVEGMPLLYLEGHEPCTTDPTGLRRRRGPWQDHAPTADDWGLGRHGIDPEHVEEMVWTDAEAQYNHEVEKLSNRPDVGMSARWPRDTY
jgi:hypothetical protein